MLRLEVSIKLPSLLEPKRNDCSRSPVRLTAVSGPLYAKPNQNQTNDPTLP